jgi:hypothetical protein
MGSLVAAMIGERGREKDVRSGLAILCAFFSPPKSYEALFACCLCGCQCRLHFGEYATNFSVLEEYEHRICTPRQRRPRGLVGLLPLSPELDLRVEFQAGGPRPDHTYNVSV